MLETRKSREKFVVISLVVLWLIGLVWSLVVLKQGFDSKNDYSVGSPPEWQLELAFSYAFFSALAVLVLMLVAIGYRIYDWTQKGND